MPSLRPVALFLLSALLGALGGCATKQVKVGSRYVVTAPKSAFFKYGPAQSFGPDTTLTKGTVVTMLESTWGFCHVMTEAGLSGYISSDDVKPAPAQAVAAAIPAPKPGGGAQLRRERRAPAHRSAGRSAPGGPEGKTQISILAEREM